MADTRHIEKTNARDHGSPVKPDTPLHRLLKLIAREVAKKLASNRR